MIWSESWALKRYAILGLARSGEATVRALVASDAEVVAWDADERKRAAIRESVRGDFFIIEDIEPWIDPEKIDALILSPGVPLNTHPLAAKARAAGVPIIGDIELFAQARAWHPPHKVVGITGTNGKSTTTALVTHILKTAGVPALMGGNIGLPILAQEPLPEGGVYVLELSSYQIDLTETLDCDVAVLLNITPDHLDRYDGLQAYAASKLRLFAMQAPGRLMVVGEHGFVGDTPFSDLFDELVDVRGREVAMIAPDVASDRGAALVGGMAMWEGRALSQQADWPALTGPHNAQNALAAIEVAKALGVADDTLVEALRTFPGLPHRMERIATLGGVTWYDDSKATNPESTAPALAAFPRVHWILGGRAKGEDLDACLPHLGHVAHAYTIGEAGAVFARVLQPHVAVTESGTLETAVKQAAANAQRGEVVLLSPAAASFDQFRDYEHRGQVFRELVEALA